MSFFLSFFLPDTWLPNVGRLNQWDNRHKFWITPSTLLGNLNQVWNRDVSPYLSMATEQSMMLLLLRGLVLLQLLFRFVLLMPFIQAIANGSGRNCLRLMFPPPLVLKLFAKPLLLALHLTRRKVNTYSLMIWQSRRMFFLWSPCTENEKDSNYLSTAVKVDILRSKCFAKPFLLALQLTYRKVNPKSIKTYIFSGDLTTQTHGSFSDHHAQRRQGLQLSTAVRLIFNNWDAM